MSDLFGPEALYTIAVEAPLKEPLTYVSPPENAPLKRGQSVQVPLSSKRVKGVVIGAAEIRPEFKLKPIFQLDDERPPLHEPFLRWAEWLSKYYFYPLGMVFDSVFPPLSRFTKRKKKSSGTPAPNFQVAPQVPPTLTEEQAKCLAGIRQHPDFGVHLLFGVTGSGKTEVYLRLMDDALKAGKQALMLVPEISLTPQLTDRFSKRFPGQVAIIHSQLSPREKTDQWWSMVSKEKSILIGARSALFCPLSDLGLIIVDEEHEPSYKQEEKLKYHGRDAAIMLARFSNCPIILGSATPSLETWNNVRDGKYFLHEMKKRVADRSLPNIEVVDLRDEREERKDKINELPFWLTERLYEAMKVTLAKNEQVALFLNRRGMAPMAQCPSCGHVEECPNCAVSLTVHAREHLVCHYCGYTQAKTKKCPSCKEGDLVPLGIGTELVESDLQKLFPEARLARADRDEIQTREELENLVHDMEDRKIDILIGTQMIAKGLDFPHLTLVGLVMADIGFHWPDFRASERSFQLLTQVSGRAGRHSSEPGTVVVQTYNPLHPSIVHTVQNSFVEFADKELETRKLSHYPPFERLALFRINSNDNDKARIVAERLAQRAEALAESQDRYKEVKVLGPAPAPLAKLRGRFRYHVLIKAPASNVLQNFCLWCLANEDWILPGTKVQVDVDPLHML